MDRWLDPVRVALDRRLSPVPLFIRDDDVGWEDERLFSLIDAVHEHGVAIDLAAIPEAVSPSLGRSLRGFLDQSGGLLAVHQHGFAHANHEPRPGKCEFGPSRTAAQQRTDIAVGRCRLEDRLGICGSAIFVPPWNRCTATTAEILVTLGFRALSRHHSETPLGVEGLGELPVHLDWSGKSGIRLGVAEWGASIARALAAATGPVGLMLHHAMMTSQDRRHVGELLEVLRMHRAVRLSMMGELCGES